MCIFTIRLKALNAITAGIATNRPTAVATSASEIPFMTTDGPPSGLFARSLNALIIPMTVPNSEKIYKADAVIVAFGFRASPATWFKDFNIQVKKNGLVIAEEKQNFKFQTSNKKIFSGGDMVRGSDLVVTAIWEGREAGKSIIKYIS